MPHEARLVPAAHKTTLVMIAERLRHAVDVLRGVHGAPSGTKDQINCKKRPLGVFYGRMVSGVR